MYLSSVLLVFSFIVTGALRGYPQEQEQEEGRRVLTLKNYDRRRVVRVGDEVFLLDKEQFLRGPLNFSLPFFGHWYDDDEIIDLSRANLSSYYRGERIFEELVYLPQALPALPGQSLALPPSPLDRSICPCGKQFASSAPLSLHQRINKVDGPPSNESEDEEELRKKIRAAATPPQYTLCLINTTAGQSLYTHLLRSESNTTSKGKVGGNAGVMSNLRHRYELISTKFLEWRRRRDIGAQSELTTIGCHLVMEVTSKGVPAEKTLCPETCLPIPYTMISVDTLQSNWWHGQGGEDDVLLCSLTWRQVRAHYYTHRAMLSQSPLSHKSTFYLEYLLTMLIERRREECSEEEKWRSDWLHGGNGEESALTHLTPRPVHGLVIWVGSRWRFSVLEAQFSILYGQNNADAKAIVAGWAATEEIYGCDHLSRCEPAISDNRYRLYMPSSSVPATSKDNPGWSCAQRRPMRALAHILWLYQPNYIFLGDDDTFISRTLLFSPKFNNYIQEHVMVENILIGDLHLSNRDVTRFGFKWGGSGYIFGKEVIRMLKEKHLRAPKRYSSYWSGPLRTKILSVLYEAMALSALNCPACLDTASSSDLYPLGVTVGIENSRVIDVCVRLMSGEDSCYHSDHALTRCFVHGLQTSLVHISNKLTTVGDEGMILGLNFFATICDPFVHLACHRYYANVSNPEQPVLIPPDHEHHYHH